MTRKELYQNIQSLNLQDEIKSVTGKNYTLVSNEVLTKIVENALVGLDEPEDGWLSFCKLLEVLSRKRILLKSEVQEILNA